MEFEKLREIIVDVMNVDEEEITMDTTFEDLGADSLDVAQIIMGIEEEFDVSFEDVNGDSIATVSDVVELIKNTVG